MRIPLPGSNLNNWLVYIIYLIVGLLILLIGIASWAAWRHVSGVHDQEHSLQEQQLYHNQTQ